MLWIQLAAKILPIILLIVVGALLKQRNFLSVNTVNELKKLVVNFALPALLFLAFLNTDFEAKHLWIILIMFFVNLVMLVFGSIFHLFVAKSEPYFPLMFTGFEMGMLGFSLFGTVYGVQNLSTMGILDLGQELYVWFALATLLLHLRDGAASIANVTLSFVTSPVIIGILLGVGLNLLGLRSFLTSNVMTGAILTAITMLSQITIPLILIIIGYQLNLHFREFFLPSTTLLIRMSLLITLALLIKFFVFDNLLHLPRIFSVALFTMFVLPPPFIMPLFMDSRSGGSQNYVGNTLSLGTLMTLVGFTILVATFGP